jgi:hypothetical protein
MNGRFLVRKAAGIRDGIKRSARAAAGHAVINWQCSVPEAAPTPEKHVWRLGQKFPPPGIRLSAAAAGHMSHLIPPMIPSPPRQDVIGRLHRLSPRMGPARKHPQLPATARWTTGHVRRMPPTRRSHRADGKDWWLAGAVGRARKPARAPAVPASRALEDRPRSSSTILPPCTERSSRDAGRFPSAARAEGRIAMARVPQATSAASRIRAKQIVARSGRQASLSPQAPHAGLYQHQLLKV